MKARHRILFFLLLTFVSCKTHYEITKKENSQYKFSDSTFTDIDSSVYKEIAPFREKMQVTMSEVLAKSTTSLERGLPESKLGNFLSDACWYEANMVSSHPDFAVFNTGGLRRPLPQGAITRGDIFELMPFENELVILTMTGTDVKKLINFIAMKGGAPVSRSLRFQIEDSAATDITIFDIPLDTNRTYKVLTSDYLANGGDSFPFTTDKKWEPVNMKVRDALIKYLIDLNLTGNKLDVELDGRIRNGR